MQAFVHLKRIIYAFLLACLFIGCAPVEHKHERETTGFVQVYTEEHHLVLECFTDHSPRFYSDTVEFNCVEDGQLSPVSITKNVIVIYKETLDNSHNQ